jgi:nitrite reductase (NADH) large subunit
LGVRVEKIVPEQQCVIVGEEMVHYDVLFVGVGARPYLPLLPGIYDYSNIFTFYSLSDVKTLLHVLQGNSAPHCLVIGGGINGLECASALASKGAKVTIVERQDRLMPAQVDISTSKWIKSRAEAQGVEVITGAHVVNMLPDDTEQYVETVQLSTNQTLRVDLIVCTTGVRLNSELLHNAGIHMVQGSVIVNEHLQTNIANIYAGGDICTTADIITKTMIRSSSWSDAMLQGLCAATQFSGEPRIYQGAINARGSRFFGMPYYGYGATLGTKIDEVIQYDGSDFLHRFYVRNGTLAGFVLIGNTDRMAAYKQHYLQQNAVCKPFIL